MVRTSDNGSYGLLVNSAKATAENVIQNFPPSHADRLLYGPRFVGFKFRSSKSADFLKTPNMIRDASFFKGKRRIAKRNCANGINGIRG